MSAADNANASSRGSIRRDGVEYVNLKVLAERLHVSSNTITTCVKKGLIAAHTFKGLNGKWTDYALAVKIYKQLVKKNRKVHSKTSTTTKKSLEKDRKDKDKDHKAYLKARKATESKLVMPSDAVDSLEISEVDAQALVGFDPEDPENADCWEYNTAGEAELVPSTGRHMVDWKKAIDKCMAKIRYQQYLEKEGSLVSKDDVMKILSSIFPKVSARMMQIPDRYASRFQGVTEDIIGRNLTNAEASTYKALLADECIAVCHDMQDDVAKAIEEMQ